MDGNEGTAGAGPGGFDTFPDRLSNDVALHFGEGGLDLQLVDLRAIGGISPASKAVKFKPNNALKMPLMAYHDPRS